MFINKALLNLNLYTGYKMSAVNVKFSHVFAVYGFCDYLFLCPQAGPELYFNFLIHKSLCFGKLLLFYFATISTFPPD